MNYDLIIVGSGNGACGFLTKYLQSPEASNKRIIVIEEGASFFDVSDISHQNNWTKSYSEGSVFKLHNALTPSNLPIISGRAAAMGGGGSINYTMIHESSDWLAANVGETAAYWDNLKAELNANFARPDPSEHLSPAANHALSVISAHGYTTTTPGPANIPDLQPAGAYSYVFPTQFNQFGQRTASGVSLVDWAANGVELRTRAVVQSLVLAAQPNGQQLCTGVVVADSAAGTSDTVSLASGGTVVLCAGARTPRLVLQHSNLVGDGHVGVDASDHILLPLGLYILDDDSIDVTGKDVYLPVFATSEWTPEEGAPGTPTTVCFDFFCGEFERLWFMLSHLYLAFVFPNTVKRVMIRSPMLFWLVSNVMRALLQIVGTLINVYYAVKHRLLRKAPLMKLKLITSIVKFNPASAGSYDLYRDRITLDWFSTKGDASFNQDEKVATDMIRRNMGMLDDLGTKPDPVIRLLLWLLVGMPYSQLEVGKFVKQYSQKFLLSEQHMAGGCLFGKALDSAGNLKGSSNVYVADLSTVPLPRVSTQMTAYLIGYHIANKLINH